MVRPAPDSAPRRRVDLRRLPYGLGYVISLAVIGLVLVLAWLASRDEPGPGWWDRFASPAILWSSPILVALVVWRYLRRLRRHREGPDNRE